VNYGDAIPTTISARHSRKRCKLLLKLDAEGARIVTVIAQAMVDYGDWDPADLGLFEADFSRVEGGEQFAAFRAVYDALGDHELAPAIATLAEGRQKYQAELEAAEAEDERQRKHRRHRHVPPAAQVLRLVPKKEADNPSDPQG